jgi:hypothetical protein
MIECDVCDEKLIPIKRKKSTNFFIFIAKKSRYKFISTFLTELIKLQTF